MLAERVKNIAIPYNFATCTLRDGICIKIQGVVYDELCINYGRCIFETPSDLYPEESVPLPHNKERYWVKNLFLATVLQFLVTKIYQLCCRKTKIVIRIKFSLNLKETEFVCPCKGSTSNVMPPSKYQFLMFII